MAYAVSDMLGSLQILERISQLDFPGTSLQKLFGWNISSFATPTLEGAVKDHELRTGQFDIFDVTRKVATARVPGTANSKQKPQVVGQTRFTIPRSAEEIELLDEDMQQQRAIGSQVSDLTLNVESYIKAQEEYLGQRFANLIEFQAASLLRGSYTFTQNGDDIEQSFTGGEITIDYQIPASNKDQLNMQGTNIIDASWATDTTDIPGHILKINKAFIELTGQGLKHIVLKSPMWNNVINNKKVQAQAGTANTPFQMIDQVSAGEFTATLRGIPWVKFHVIDYGLEVWNGSAYEWTDLIEDDHGAFIPDPAPRWVEYIRGCEWVTEGPNGNRSKQFGFYPYAYPKNNPSGWSLNAVFNGLPALKRPKAIAYADLTP